MSVKKKLVALILMYLLNVLAYGGSAPKFSLYPTTPTTLSIAKNDVAKVSYIVVNNTKLTRNLIMVPIAGISQITSNTKSCAKIFTLNSKESCSLELELNGNKLPPVVNDGPVICKTQLGTNLPDPFLCSGPSQINKLKITLLPEIISPVIAFGQYVDTLDTLRPWLTVSKDNGLHYKFPTSVTQPKLSPQFESAGVLFSGLCHHQFCLVAGQYASDNYRPMLGQSSDGGVTWKFPAIVSQLKNLTPSAGTSSNVFPMLTGTACNNKVCISVGYYNDERGFSFPLLTQTKNQGKSWTIPPNIAIPATIVNFESGILNTASCNESICIAGGNFSTTDSSKPLIALTRDNGVHWTFPAAAYNPVTTPAYNRVGTYRGTSCNDKICIAAGSYYDGEVGRPLLAITHDNGVSWAYPTSITQPILDPIFAGEGVLNKVSCSNNVCVAGGFYQTDVGFAYTKTPLVAVSRDNGITWKYSEQFTKIKLTPAFQGPGEVNDVSCYDKLCIVVGSYQPERPHPFLAVSHDAGVTWTFPSSISNLDISPTASSGRLVAVSCNANICLAAGVYTDDQGRYPYIVQSTNKGHTWTYPASVRSPTLTPASEKYSENFRGAAAGFK